MTNRNTIKERIKVMQSYLEGETIEVKTKGSGNSWYEIDMPLWDFSSQEYRVKEDKEACIYNYTIYVIDGDYTIKLIFNCVGPYEFKLFKDNSRNRYLDYSLKLVTNSRYSQVKKSTIEKWLKSNHINYIDIVIEDYKINNIN